MNLPALHFFKSLLNLNLFQRHPFLFDLQIIIDNVLNLSIIMSKKKSFKYWQFWLYHYLYTHGSTGPVANSEKELGILYLMLK